MIKKHLLSENENLESKNVLPEIEDEEDVNGNILIIKCKGKYTIVDANHNYLVKDDTGNAKWFDKITYGTCYDIEPVSIFITVNDIYYSVYACNSYKNPIGILKIYSCDEIIEFENTSDVIDDNVELNYEVIPYLLLRKHINYTSRFIYNYINTDCELVFKNWVKIDSINGYGFKHYETLGFFVVEYDKGRGWYDFIDSLTGKSYFENYDKDILWYDIVSKLYVYPSCEKSLYEGNVIIVKNSDNKYNIIPLFRDDSLDEPLRMGDMYRPYTWCDKVQKVIDLENRSYLRVNIHNINYAIYDKCVYETDMMFFDGNSDDDDKDYHTVWIIGKDGKYYADSYNCYNNDYISHKDEKDCKFIKHNKTIKTGFDGIRDPYGRYSTVLKDKKYAIWKNGLLFDENSVDDTNWHDGAYYIEDGNDDYFVFIDKDDNHIPKYLTVYDDGLNRVDDQNILDKIKKDFGITVLNSIIK